jgi:hypothetical protein
MRIANFPFTMATRTKANLYLAPKSRAALRCR